MAKVPPVKGTRDFYPPDMAVRNFIIDGWKRISRRNGFVEYDGPIFEHLQLYTQKSGEGIVSELFNLTDRGGRDLAIRPEMTPTLARMVNQQINALPRPIKWFSVPRCCRAENPQKGRLREFFQWNVDIIGDTSVLADAECIFTAVDYLRSVGLTGNDIVVRISNRAMLAALLEDIGFASDQLGQVYALLDKRPKLPPDTFLALVAEKIPDPALRDKLMQLQAITTLEDATALAHSPAAHQAIADLRQLLDHLRTLGVGDYCAFDIQIVRGLAYYTGPVFEIFSRGDKLRAVGGGGRYDNLLAGLGGPQVSGTGLGMGDVVLGILLEEKGLLQAQNEPIDFYVINTDAQLTDHCLALVGQLRQRDFACSFNYKPGPVGKQLKQASAANARFAVILGTETIERNEVSVKNLTTGEQNTMTTDAFLAQPDLQG